MQKQKAFTLFELLIIFIFISILMMISLPSLRQFLQNTLSQVLQLQLTRAIQLAEQEARVYGLPIALCGSRSLQSCDGSWLAGQIIFVNENQDGSVQDKQHIVGIFQKITTQGQLYFRSFPVYRHYLLFFPESWNDNAAFWYCLRKRDVPLWALLLAKSGRVRIVYPHHGVIRDNEGTILHCNGR